MTRAAMIDGSHGDDQLRTMHADIDRRVRELDRRAYLTPTEQGERAELKKLKLAVKDRISSPPPLASSR